MVPDLIPVPVEESREPAEITCSGGIKIDFGAMFPGTEEEDNG